MKKSILILGVTLGIGLIVGGCRNHNEVSYEIPSTAAGVGAKPKPGASPSAFGPEVNPGR